MQVTLSAILAAHLFPALDWETKLIDGRTPPDVLKCHAQTLEVEELVIGPVSRHWRKLL